MALYVYAIADGARSRLSVRGVGGGRVRGIACGSFHLLVEDAATAPALDATALGAHDAVVRRLARVADALLPVRFGTLVADEHEAARALAPRASEIEAALALVRGCEQMTVRVYGEVGDVARASEPVVEGAGPGARYLVDRLRAHRAVTEAPALATLRRRLAPVVRAERVEPHRTPPLLATVYHLIVRGEAARYRVAASPRPPHGGASLAVTGPWPPYAFAPDAVA